MTRVLAIDADNLGADIDYDIEFGISLVAVVFSCTYPLYFVFRKYR